MQQVTYTDWQTVQGKGGHVTFRPLGGNRVRCNQLPHLGRLTQNQANSVRNAIAGMGVPAGQSSHKKTSVPTEAPLLDGFVSHGSSYAICPNCRRSTYVGSTLGRRKCEECHQPFNAKSY